jgi:DNA adenine methylase
MKYPGGKRWLAKDIAAMLPPHRCYVEVFGGMGAVLLAKEPSPVEVYNDVDEGLVTVFRVARHHPDELAKELRYCLFSRSERLHWLESPGETDIQRAARWIAARWTGFAGLAGRGFHVSRSCAAASRDTLIKNIMAVSDRLARVSIECLGWRRLIDLYDHTPSGGGVVFFLDPPYADGDQKLYASGGIDHAELRERLRTVKGDWILTYGDHPLIRELYADCEIMERERWRGINNAARKRYVELLIRPKE